MVSAAQSVSWTGRRLALVCEPHEVVVTPALASPSPSCQKCVGLPQIPGHGLAKCWAQLCELFSPHKHTQLHRFLHTTNRHGPLTRVSDLDMVSWCRATMEKKDLRQLGTGEEESPRWR